jgi:hypothetical protein
LLFLDRGRLEGDFDVTASKPWTTRGDVTLQEGIDEITAYREFVRDIEVEVE